jgi:hypothetical protein
VNETWGKITALLVELGASNVIAIAAAVIAVLSLFATFWQAWIARQHNKLSVRPFITCLITARDDEPVSLSIRNDGLGTAVMNDIRVFYKGVEFYLGNFDLHEALDHECRRVGLTLDLSAFGPGFALAPGSTEQIFSFENSAEDREKHAVASELIRQLQFNIEYESLYGERRGKLVQLNTRD